MILSHRHRFIFVKTMKTAGTSIELSLSRFCGDDDVITPVAPDEDERLRRAHGGVGPQHYERACAWRELRTRDVVGMVKNRRRPRREIFWNHIPAREIRRRVPAEVWDGYFTFAFTRNPWDRFISRYYWNLSKGEPPIGLSRAVHEYDLDENWPIYTIDDEIAVDFVGRYETLDDDLAHACGRIGISWDHWLPNAKSGHRPPNAERRELLDDDVASVIAERCAREIERFGYTF